MLNKVRLREKPWTSSSAIILVGFVGPYCALFIICYKARLTRPSISVWVVRIMLLCGFCMEPRSNTDLGSQISLNFYAMLFFRWRVMKFSFRLPVESLAAHQELVLFSNCLPNCGFDWLPDLWQKDDRSIRWWWVSVILLQVGTSIAVLYSSNIRFKYVHALLNRIIISLAWLRLILSASTNTPSKPVVLSVGARQLAFAIIAFHVRFLNGCELRG